MGAMLLLGLLKQKTIARRGRSYRFSLFLLASAA